MNDLCPLRQNLSQHTERLTQSQVGTIVPPVSLSTQPSAHERKFNLVIQGIAECNKGTPKHTRLSTDLNEVTSVLSSINTNISSNSIRDCFRLGKYSTNRSRPLLVKLTRSCDVHTTLSLRLSEFPGVFIKPDLSPKDRHTESLLLKERRNLINSGVDRRPIRLNGNYLIVNRQRFGFVQDSKFQLYSTEDSNATVSHEEDSAVDPLINSQDTTSATGISN